MEQRFSLTDRRLELNNGDLPLFKTPLSYLHCVCLLFRTCSILSAMAKGTRQKRAQTLDEDAPATDICKRSKMATTDSEETAK